MSLRRWIEENSGEVYDVLGDLPLHELSRRCDDPWQMGDLIIRRLEIRQSACRIASEAARRDEQQERAERARDMQRELG